MDLQGPYQLAIFVWRVDAGVRTGGVLVDDVWQGECVKGMVTCLINDQYLQWEDTAIWQFLR